MTKSATFDRRAPRAEDLETLKGKVVRICARRDTWAKIEVLPEGASAWDTRVVVGDLPDIKEGHFVELKGTSSRDPKWGMQFKVKLAPSTYVPPTREGVESWLKTFKGIGPAVAAKIFDHFGPDPEVVIKTLQENPLRLGDVPGVEALAERIMETFTKEISQGELQSVLYSVGLGTSMVRKIADIFGESAVKVVKENPYRLIGKVRGIGFESADKIAQHPKVGIKPTSPFRIRAGLEHVLDLSTQEGHVFMTRGALLGKATQLLGQPVGDVQRELNYLLDPKNVYSRLVNEPCGVYLKPLHRAETSVAAVLCQRLAAGDFDELPQEVYEAWREISKMSLSEGQIAACRLALQKRVCIITGGAGVGKTTVLRAIVEMADAMNLRLTIAAPTGRAAKRAEEVTRRKSYTVHRLLGVKGDYGTGDDQSDNSILMDIDLLVLEELSMVALPLMATVLSNLPDHVRLLMVGDPNQLPAIGPGMVLRDLIESKVIPVAELKEIFRQAAGSQIIRGATAINSGECPEFTPWSGEIRPGLLALLEAPDASALPRQLQEAIREVLMQEKAPGRRYTLDDVQVLVPQQTTDIGVKALNEQLQSYFNSMGPPLKNRPNFRLEDKVMQIVNNYDLEVMNGDVGYIRRSFDKDGAEAIEVEFYKGKNQETGEDEYRRVVYNKESMSELVLAYACTFHKSQGSEYPVVFLVCHQAHGFMLNRKLVYTGITRGKMAVVVVGTEDAVARASTNVRVEQRNGWLLPRLREEADKLSLPRYTHGAAEEVTDPDGF